MTVDWDGELKKMINEFRIEKGQELNERLDQMTLIIADTLSAAKIPPPNADVLSALAYLQFATMGAALTTLDKKDYFQIADLMWDATRETMKKRGMRPGEEPTD